MNKPEELIDKTRSLLQSPEPVREWLKSLPLKKKIAEACNSRQCVVARFLEVQGISFPNVVSDCLTVVFQGEKLAVFNEANIPDWLRSFVYSLDVYAVAMPRVVKVKTVEAIAILDLVTPPTTNFHHNALALTASALPMN